MAKVFLDANILINIVEKRGGVSLDDLNEHELFISPLSVHVLMYVAKQKIPYPVLFQMIHHFSLVPFGHLILQPSLEGPTNDFEDNVQLHSAAQAECDVFLTEDRELLDLTFFGKTKVLQKLS